MPRGTNKLSQKYNWRSKIADQGLGKTVRREGKAVQESQKTNVNRT